MGRKMDTWGLVEFEVYVVRVIQGFWVSDVRAGYEVMKLGRFTPWY